ncbi:MAG: Rieske 2Fe-2S domain-containing protein [Planctomycetaceae bacterium]
MGTRKVKVAVRSDIPPGEGKEFTIADRIIALFEQQGEYFAIDGICPHAGGPIGKGTLNGLTVTCPWHGWQFDIASGKHCLTPNICQETFPVSIEGEDIFIELPE